MNKTNNKAVFAFRWRYVALPWIFLLISIAIVAIFYNRLPFQVAWHFKSDGSADGWVIQPMIVFWVLLPQVVLTIGATVITWIISVMAVRYLQAGSALVKPQKIMLIMGNMVAIPKLIILFAMLDIFSYNLNQTHLRPSVLVFALIVMVLGGIILSAFFVQTMMQVWKGKIIPNDKLQNPNDK